MADCEAIHGLVRSRWGILHDELAHEMRGAASRGGEVASGRIRVGVYIYYEDCAADSQGKTPS